jgi:hypothetical protein
MRVQANLKQLISVLVVSSAFAVLAIGCAVVEPEADTSTTSLAVEAAPAESDTGAVTPMDDECGAITLQEALEAGVEDIGTSSHDVPPPGETNCSCSYRWECRGTDCGGYGRAYRLECCTCKGGFGCSSHWEATQMCC